MSLFADLPEDQLASLLPGVALRRCRRGAFILHAGERAEALYIMLSGRAKVLNLGEDGREFILSFIGASDFFGEMGLLDDLPCPASIQTLQPCELLRISKAVFMHCLNDENALAMRMMRALVKRLRVADRRMESLALMDVYGRVARVLPDFAETVDGKSVIVKAPPQQVIARMIGASREMVGRVMKDLKISGHISVDKRRIVLLDKLDTRRRPS